MGSLIRKYGPCPFLTEDSNPDLFDRLANSIIGQQLSTKAAASIRTRILSQAGSKAFSAQFFLNVTLDNLRAYGLSRAKAKTLQDISARIRDDHYFLIRLKELSNEEISKILCEIKGIGPWTAKMFQMFALMRQDIFSLEDAGLMRGIRITYALGEVIGASEIEHITNQWTPYKTIGAWHMWQVANAQPQKLSIPRSDSKP
mgnify:FL=1